tara:strand:+ start:300 stop:632 length:333 start_codon:yes stop_codon:yes gene_type:complete
MALNRNILVLPVVGKYMDEEEKQYVRFKNALLSIDEIQAFTWSTLKETDNLRNMFSNDRIGVNGIPKYYKVVVFLRGGQNFVSACTKKTLDNMIIRFKRRWSDEKEEEWQ